MAIGGRHIIYAPFHDTGEPREARRILDAAFFAILMALTGTQAKASGTAAAPSINRSVVVDAPVAAIWQAWTTSEGVPTFMGLGAEVELRPRGAFRVLFDRNGKSPIERGNDGQILAFEPMKFLSITWMTPMFMPELRGESTSIVLHFMPICDGKTTRIDLVNTGYGFGPKWREAFTYNSKGWVTVLSRLAYRFKYGPINWDTFKEDSKGRMSSIDLPLDRSNESLAETAKKYCKR
jgi:uncharacterized protein YndB with AHSA1/START domain